MTAKASSTRPKVKRARTFDSHGTRRAAKTEILRGRNALIKRIAMAGGQVVTDPSQDKKKYTIIVIVGDGKPPHGQWSMNFMHMYKSGNYDVVHADWVLDSLRAGAALELSPRYMCAIYQPHVKDDGLKDECGHRGNRTGRWWGLVDATVQGKYRASLDSVGDSYTEPLTPEDMDRRLLLMRGAGLLSLPSKDRSHRYEQQQQQQEEEEEEEMTMQSWEALTELSAEDAKQMALAEEFLWDPSYILLFDYSSEDHTTSKDGVLDTGSAAHAKRILEAAHMSAVVRGACCKSSLSCGRVTHIVVHAGHDLSPHVRFALAEMDAALRPKVVSVDWMWQSLAEGHYIDDAEHALAFLT